MENKQPLVSIIMNCYNSDEYLKEAIDSVMSQTYENWEIIFWDNQSTDKSAEIVKTYQDDRIKYFYALTHTTLGKARNLAVEKCAGEWIGFLDCDDLWSKNKLERQIKDISNEIGMIYSRMEFLIETSGNITAMAKSIKKNIYPKMKKLPSGDIFYRLLYECFIPLPSVLIKKSLFEKVGGIDNSLKVAEDYDVFLKISKISKAKAFNDVLCKYRIHEKNLSHTNMEKTFEESIHLIKRYSPDNKVNDAYTFWLKKRNYYLFRTNIILKVYHTIIYVIYKIMVGLK